MIFFYVIFLLNAWCAAFGTRNVHFHAVWTFAFVCVAALVEVRHHRTTSREARESATRAQRVADADEAWRERIREARAHRNAR